MTTLPALDGACACGNPSVVRLQAIEAFKEKVAALRKKARRVRELERRRLRRMEQRTGARSSAPARDEVLLHPAMSLTPFILKGELFHARPLMPRKYIGMQSSMPGN